MATASRKRMDPDRLRNLRKLLGDDSSDEDYFEESYNYEQEDSDESSEEDVACGLKKAIGLDPDDIKHYDFLQGPTNGSQFLLNAMRERKTLPKIAVADPTILKTKLERMRKMKRIAKRNCANREHELGNSDEKTNDPSDSEVEGEELLGELFDVLLPNAAWQSQALKQFEQLRLKVDRQRQQVERKQKIISLPEDFIMPELESDWFQFCLGQQFDISSGKFQKTATKFTFTTIELFEDYLEHFFKLQSDRCFSHYQSPADSSAIELQNQNDQPQPVDSEGQQTNEPDLDRTTESEWKMTPTTGSIPSLSVLLNTSQRTIEKLISYNLRWTKENHNRFLSNQQCQWIYSLMVCAQIPLEPSVVSDLRGIAKSCRNQRKKLDHLMRGNLAKVEVDEELDESHLAMYLKMLNLFIVVVGKYFRQQDLLDS